MGKKRFTLVLILLSMASPAMGFVGVRVGAGGEVNPIVQGEVHFGFGASARADLTLDRLASTTLEIGWRRWPTTDPSEKRWGRTGEEIRRVGIIQRFHIPMRTLSPYFGGEYLWQKDRVTGSISDSRWDDEWEPGLALLLGTEIPIGIERFMLDTAARVEIDVGDGDSAVWFVCFSVQPLWKVI